MSKTLDKETWERKLADYKTRMLANVRVPDSFSLLPDPTAARRRKLALNSNKRSVNSMTAASLGIQADSIGELSDVRLRMLLVETHFDMLNRYLRVKSQGRLSLRGGDQANLREKEAMTHARKHFADLWLEHGAEVADEIMSGETQPIKLAREEAVPDISSTEFLLFFFEEHLYRVGEELTSLTMATSLAHWAVHDSEGPSGC
jgi:hypothetical protein